MFSSTHLATAKSMYQYWEKSARYSERTHDKQIPFTIISQTGKREKNLFLDFVFFKVVIGRILS